jgi:DNA ligase-1
MITEANMHHGRHWSGQNVRGWYASEKFRGCRVFWDGAAMWTRGGVQAELPLALISQLPNGRQLDGELWAGRGPENGAQERAAVAAAVHGRFTAKVRFMVFDAPDVFASWPERMAAAAGLLAGSTFARPVGVTIVKGIAHLERLFAEVHQDGGEGLMLRSPKAPAAYEVGRTATLLKVKLDPAMSRGIFRFAP